MLAGISTACFYPSYTEEALKLLMERPVQAVEVFFNADEELQPSFCRSLRQMCDANGTRIVSVHPYTSSWEPMLFFSEYGRRFEQGRELYKKYYEAANNLGADIVVFHGNRLAYKILYEDYFERYERLLSDAEEQGIALCHENVSYCMGFEPAFFRALHAALPQAGFVLDTKQAHRAGQELGDFISAMSDGIRHVHISDYDDSNFCLVPGRGIFNIPHFLETMGKTGFAGSVIVEVYRNNFKDIVEIYKGYQQLLTDISTAT